MLILVKKEEAIETRYICSFILNVFIWIVDNEYYDKAKFQF